MSHINWVPRQNKLETPKEKDKGKKTRSPRIRWMRTRYRPPKPTRKSKSLVRETPTIVSRCGENTVLWQWHWPRLLCARAEILKLKQKSAVPRRRPVSVSVRVCTFVCTDKRGKKMNNQGLERL
jgi:hypothetical protein